MNTRTDKELWTMTEREKRIDTYNFCCEMTRKLLRGELTDKGFWIPEIKRLLRLAKQ